MDNQIAIKEIENFKQAVIEEMKDVKNDIAVRAVKMLCDISPIKTGQYILSHRVQGGAADPNHAPRQIRKNPKALREPAKQELIAKIKIIPLETPIHISNNVPHAELVENIGWASRGPHQVYRLTALSLL